MELAPKMFKKCDLGGWQRSWFSGTQFLTTPQQIYWKYATSLWRNLVRKIYYIFSLNDVTKGADEEIASLNDFLDLLTIGHRRRKNVLKVGFDFQLSLINFNIWPSPGRKSVHLTSAGFYHRRYDERSSDSQSCCCCAYCCCYCCYCCCDTFLTFSFFGRSSK